MALDPQLALSYRKFSDFIKFKQKVRIHFERKQYTVKTVENRRELVQALMLRYEVFHREFMGKKFPIGIDTDRYDSLGDLLVIIDNRVGKVVGTYRFLSSDFTTDFYSATEFHLEKFLGLPGTKLELSRACIQKEHRQGIVIGLLWRGISEYMQAVNAKYLFGLSSVQVMDVDATCRIHRSLEEAGHMTDEFGITPLAGWNMPGYAERLGELRKEPSTTEDKKVIPPLFQAYLKAGAKVCGEAALDSKFKCVDFLTVLNMGELTKAYEKKFVSR